jgi:hypothetical protein
MTCIAIEAALAAAVGETNPALRVIHREAPRNRPWRHPATWGRVSADAALSALTDAPAGSIVLVRSAEADPGAACVAPVARVAGRTVLLLPDPFDAAVWVAGLALHWCASGLDKLDRAIAVACGVASGHGGLPCPQWGGDGSTPPDLHPRVLGRWASRAFVACDWCRTGGGAVGAACATCGAPVRSHPSNDAKTGARVVPLRRIA